MQYLKSLKNSLIFQPEFLANLTVKELAGIKEKMIVVENIGMEISKQTILSMFKKIGKIEKVYTVTNGATRLCYLILNDAEDTDKFIKEINLQTFEDCVLFAFKYTK